MLDSPMLPPRLLVALVVAALLTASPAMAGDDTVEVDDDGTIRMTRVVPLPREQLLSVLSSPKQSEDLSPDVISKEILSRGECTEYRVHTKGLRRPLVYDYKSCPTDYGLREDLVASDDFDAYVVEWHLRSVQGGTEVSYHLLVKPRLRVPDALVRAGTKRSMRATMDRLVERGGGS